MWCGLVVLWRERIGVHCLLGTQPPKYICMYMYMVHVCSTCVHFMCIPVHMHLKFEYWYTHTCTHTHTHTQPVHQLPATQQEATCQACQVAKATLLCFQCLPTGFPFCDSCSSLEHNRDFPPVQRHSPKPFGAVK